MSKKGFFSRIWHWISNLFNPKNNHGLGNLLPIFEKGSDEHACLNNIIGLIARGKLDWVHIPSTNPPGRPETGEHQKWENEIANQVVEPLQLYYPTSLNDASDDQSITKILERALSQNLAVKAAGSGHSYSDVATTPDLFINTHGLKKPSSESQPITGQLSMAQLKDGHLPLAVNKVDWPDYKPEQNRALFETESGITIHDLNNTLDARNVALENMGGFDEQTIIGAIATSTHGTGAKIGPFPDMVRSLVLATTGKYDGTTVGGSEPTNGIYYYRIEPTDGITDPAKYNDPNIQLIQDDNVFNATIVSMGCFGVIYSLVLEVMQKYWLEESRMVTTLDKIFAQLKPNDKNPGSLPDVLHNNRHMNFLVNPYPIKDGKILEMDPNEPVETYFPHFTCVLEVRNISKEPDEVKEPQGHRNHLSGFLAKFKVSFEATATLMNFCPKLVPKLVDATLKSQKDHDYINLSYKIFNSGLNQYSGYATEIGFPTTASNQQFTPEPLRKAIDSISKTAQNARKNGAQYQTSPYAVRFVQKSRALLSMMEGVDTVMIEMDMVTGTYGGPETMLRYQNSMYPLGGRPHWGLEFDHLTGSNGLIKKLYPKLDDWLAVYRQFNGRGTFNNSFTDRVGFTESGFVREIV